MNNNNINRTLLFSGLVSLSFFAFILFVLIPHYIEEPGFIPPLAVKSDTWPKAIAILGMAMGFLLIINAFKLPVSNLGNEDKDNEDSPATSISVYLGRLAIILLSFLAFAIMTPYLGFLVSTTLLTVFLMITIQYPANYSKSLIIGITFTLLIFFIFTKGIHVQFPIGSILKSFLN